MWARERVEHTGSRRFTEEGTPLRQLWEGQHPHWIGTFWWYGCFEVTHPVGPVPVRKLNRHIGLPSSTVIPFVWGKQILVSMSPGKVDTTVTKVGVWARRSLDQDLKMVNEQWI